MPPPVARWCCAKGVPCRRRRARRGARDTRNGSSATWQVWWGGRHAILLTGGSAFGLGRRTGVCGFSRSTAGVSDPGGAGADRARGGVVRPWHRRSDVRPDPPAGYAACQAASEAIAEGCVGRGHRRDGGQTRWPGPEHQVRMAPRRRRSRRHTIAALIAVNAVGGVYERDGRSHCATPDSRAERARMGCQHHHWGDRDDCAARPGTHQPAGDHWPRWIRPGHPSGAPAYDGDTLLHSRWPATPPRHRRTRAGQAARRSRRGRIVRAVRRGPRRCTALPSAPGVTTSNWSH